LVDTYFSTETLFFYGHNAEKLLVHKVFSTTPYINPPGKRNISSGITRPGHNTMQHKRICISFLLFIIHHVYGRMANDENHGQCDVIGELDVFLLLPTSAHTNQDRLKDVTNFIYGTFNENDIHGDEGVQITTLVYKKVSRVKFTPGEIESLANLGEQLKKVRVTRRINRQMSRETPTFASGGLATFISHYEDLIKREQFRKNVPALLFFVITEQLEQQDLAKMAQKLVQISSNTDVFTFIFIANVNGPTHYDQPTISLPHESWNALAIDDNGDLTKYQEVVRRTMCRLARNNICLMFGEANKPEKGSILQKSATERISVTNRRATPMQVVVIPNTCCGNYIFSKPYDTKSQQCCDVGYRAANSAKIAFQDDGCEAV